MNTQPTGFSLIELILAIVIVAVAAVAIGSAFAYISRSQRLGVDLQGATQIAQECAAHVIGSGRKPGSYAAVVPVASPSTICDVLPGAAPFNREVNVTAVAAGPLCTAGWACKRIEIIVTRAGADIVTLNFMLVNY
jgi:prepilin-type N-terminal cleavage/methylation domain-containing protein